MVTSKSIWHKRGFITCTITKYLKIRHFVSGSESRIFRQFGKRLVFSSLQRFLGPPHPLENLFLKFRRGSPIQPDRPSDGGSTHRPSHHFRRHLDRQFGPFLHHHPISRQHLRRPVALTRVHHRTRPASPPTWCGRGRLRNHHRAGLLARGGHGRQSARQADAGEGVSLSAGVVLGRPRLGYCRALTPDGRRGAGSGGCSVFMPP